jgi:hypothetical protein
MTPASNRFRCGTRITSFVGRSKVDDEIGKLMVSCSREMVRTAEVGRRIRLPRRPPSRRLVSARSWTSINTSDLFICPRRLSIKLPNDQLCLTTCLSYTSLPCQRPSATWNSRQPPKTPFSSSSWPPRTRKRTRHGVPMSWRPCRSWKRLSRATTSRRQLLLRLAKDQSMTVDISIENTTKRYVQMEGPQQCLQNRLESSQCASPATLREDQRRSQGGRTIDRRRDSG